MSTETLRTIRDGEPRTATFTFTFTQLPSSERERRGMGGWGGGGGGGLIGLIDEVGGGKKHIRTVNTRAVHSS